MSKRKVKLIQVNCELVVVRAAGHGRVDSDVNNRVVGWEALTSAMSHLFLLMFSFSLLIPVLYYRKCVMFLHTTRPPCYSFFFLLKIPSGFPASVSYLSH